MSCGCESSEPRRGRDYDSCYKKEHRSRFVIVDRDIKDCEVWRPEREYIVNNEIHVRDGAKLVIKPRTKVIFRHGEIPEEERNGDLPFASLVCDSGSKFKATRVEFVAESHSLQGTGGLILCGSLENTIFEDYNSVASRVGFHSDFLLDHVSFNFLGSDLADINALTLLSVSGEEDPYPEIHMSNVSIYKAGDDGIEIFGGKHRIDSLVVHDAGDDSVDLDSNASLTVSKLLHLEKSNHTGVVEVVGDGGTVNTLRLDDGCHLIMRGPRVTDKPDTPTEHTEFTGLFFGLHPLDPVDINATSGGLASLIVGTTL